MSHFHRPLPISVFLVAQQVEQTFEEKYRVSNTAFPSPEAVSTALDPRTLHLLVLPTEDCNFRCTYCYEDHVRGKMRPEIVSGIKQLIDRRLGDVRAIELSWFGGEPLLAKDVVFDLCEFVHQRCQDTGVIRLSGDMVTNAYFLTLSVAERLAAAGHRRFHISLDGIGDDHDRLRPLASGRGTFERIWENLTTLRGSDLDFIVVLRLHYGMASLQAAETLCRAVNVQFGHDHRFRVLLQRIANLGGENTGKIIPLPIDEAMRRGRHLTGLMPDIVVPDVETAEDGICYAAQPNHLLIRADGRIGKCAVNLRDVRNTIGHLDTDGRLQIDNDRLRPWLKGFASLDADLLTCPYQWVRTTPAPTAQPVIFAGPAMRTAPSTAATS